MDRLYLLGRNFVVFSCSDFSAFALPEFFPSMKSVWTVGILE